LKTINFILPARKPMITDRLKRAIQLIEEGKQIEARDLLLEEIKSNPENLSAWLWALEVAANEKEKRVILQKILAIDPAHQAALKYLEKLDRKRGMAGRAAQDPGKGAEEKKSPDQPKDKPGFSGLLKLFVDWITSLPSGCFYIAIFVSIVGGLFIYTRINTSLFGLTGTDFDNLVISNSYELISSEAYYWEVQFEGVGETKYTGIVRHVAPIRIPEFAILTHDILVTSGDFADPKIVNTNVIDHKFFWKSPNSSSPSGSINLIHAIPANKGIYQELLEIDKWDTVKITGREILTVKAYRGDETFLGTWLDTGCNTLLVESVTILEDTDSN
jgi:hypothetical protein